MGFGIVVLLLASNAIGFEILDTTDEEWVAPGYEVIEEAVIDPLEFGEPFLDDGSPVVGVHLSFIDEETGEAWRVVFVLDRKVVVLEEGSDPVEIPVDLGIESCAFSPSGKFVVVHDGAEEYTGRNAARIDTETGEAETFDSQPNGRPGSRNIVVSNIGSVLCGWTFFDENLDLIGRGAELQNPGAPVVSSTGTFWAVAEGYGWSIHLLDQAGAEIWSRSSSGTLSDRMVFSPDEAYLAVPLYSGLEIWETETGQTVWKDESARIPNGEILFVGSNDMVFSCSEQMTFVSGLDAAQTVETISVETGTRYSINPYCSSPDEEMVALVQRGPVLSSIRQWVLLSDDRSVIWLSGSNRSETNTVFGGNRPGLRPQAVLSSDSSCLLYTVLGCVRIVNIEGSR